MIKYYYQFYGDIEFFWEYKKNVFFIVCKNIDFNIISVMEMLTLFWIILVIMFTFSKYCCLLLKRNRKMSIMFCTIYYFFITAYYVVQVYQCSFNLVSQALWIVLINCFHISSYHSHHFHLLNMSLNWKLFTKIFTLEIFQYGLLFIFWLNCILQLKTMFLK